MKDTIFKGKTAEQKVILRAMEKNCIVSRPICEGRYDLIVDDNDKIYKAQVKYANGKDSKSKDSVVAQLRTRKGGKTDYRYQEKDIDVLLIYVPKIDKVLWIDKDRFLGKASLNIRLTPPSNGHKNRSNFADELIW